MAEAAVMICLICDDISAERAVLVDYLRRFERENNIEIEITEFDCAEELIAHYRRDPRANLIFMDIYMSGMDGMSAAKLLRSEGYIGGFVFGTSSADFAAESYDVEAIYYLVKPFGYDKFQSAMNRCRTLWEKSMRSISFTSDRLDFTVFLRDILYIEVSGNGCVVHTLKDSHKTYTRLGELEDEIESQEFLRIGRSYLVNVNHITDSGRDSITLRGGVTVPIPVKLKTQVREKLLALRFSQLREDS